MVCTAHPVDAASFDSFGPRVMIGGLALLLILVLRTNAGAQIRQQVVVGGAVTEGRHDFASSSGETAGYALIVPLTRRIFVRPAAGLANVQPVGRPRVLAGQIGALLGVRLNPVLTMLAGGCATVLFQKGATTVIPTVIVSSAMKVTAHVSVLTPVTLNVRGRSVGLQLGFAW